MLGKLSEAMKKLIQNQGDTTQGKYFLNRIELIISFFLGTTNTNTTAAPPPPAPPTEGEDAVPISAKHLERLERVSSEVT